MNRFKTFLLLSTLTALLVWGGHAMAGRVGAVLALVMAFVMNFGAYWFSDKFVLRMYDAREVTLGEAPSLYRMVQNLAQRAKIPMPRLYVIPEEAPNAFATGRNPEHGVVAVTEGLLRALDEDEVEGVIAHEMGHIKHRDTLLMSIAATMAGAISSIANFAMWGALLGGGRHDDEDGPSPLVGLIGVILAPITASLIHMAISRAREFMADNFAGRVTANPMALASALRKIEAWSQRIPMHAGSPETAHLFIQNPFADGGLVNLFRTHPRTEERIARLRELAGSRQFAA